MKSSGPSTVSLLPIACRWRDILAGGWGTSYFGDLRTSTIGADTPDPAEYEPDRLAVRQRQGGELHEHAEARRGRWAGVPDRAGGAPLYRQLHRGGLQLAAATFDPEL